ncbi:putative DNA-binding transcriptional regulator YafY [Bifidobacterium commune]|uniref:Predicted DNA-binding transcriptional regulator YafY, contains an HTH and WYL domains n=1 Tax=Bifidobacterium commune TaxID=1505727 RepID=A0A1C4H1S9_9BIFI|nr:WYL domain-containing protein [Bifidobacterium commune]MBB2954805.1 putative DNA-binding transcriptional regulator YafY [Bifidobacterium commune]SCC78823.1 Predicted DNA-binding transcriptional regulator YafY, contains an HTH and WYL domains [Bifidobacterium commune]
MAEGSNGRRRFSDKWGKHELDVLAVLSSAFPQWLTSRQIAQRVKAYADSYGELADQAAKAAFAKQFQRDRAKLAAMGIAIESRQPEYSSKSEGQDFASYRLQLGDEPRVRLRFKQEDLPVLAAANYLARSMSVSSSSLKQDDQHASRTAPRVPQTPTPGLGLDSIAPGLGTQPIPDNLMKVVDQRRFAATIDVDGGHMNVAYTDSDDLAMFMLEHPGSSVVSPQEAVDAWNRRLEAASKFTLADASLGDARESIVTPAISKQTVNGDVNQEASKSHSKRSSSFQTGSEVDRRLRLMLFLSAHLGEEYSLEELAQRFIGEPKNDDERKKGVAVIRKDINTLTTVSDDGEMAGSQFFDIDWSLLDADGIVSATNSLGLERLAGISQQYLSMLTASVSYLAHSSLLPAKQREQAESLYFKLRQHVKPGETPWLSLTGYEVEPRSFDVVKRAISTDSLLDMEYTDGTGRTRRKLVAPSKIFVDEGVYYVAVWTDVSKAAPKEKKEFVSKDTTINKANGLPRIWQVLRLSRIEKAELVKPLVQLDIPDVPVSELRKWSFDNGTPTVFITDKRDLPFVKTLSGATVEPYGDGEKVHLMVSSDSWFVAFAISHARHITAVAPEPLLTMVLARAHRELSLENNEEQE